MSSPFENMQPDLTGRRGEGRRPGKPLQVAESAAERLAESSAHAGASTFGRAPLGRQAGLSDALPVLHLLVFDEDDAVRNACAEIARKMGFAVTTAADIKTAREILNHQKLDLLLLDLKMPEAGHRGGGLALLAEVKQLYPETLVIVMTAFATVSSAVEAMRVGASDYLTKPFALEELASILERAGERQHFNLESRRLREKMRQHKAAGHLVGRSPEMEKLYRILSKVTHSSHPVLIVGESGTGKELIARAIHFNGANSTRPFVPVDCGSLVPSMVEAELFGYVKGAFPGATRTRDGLLVTAEGGTVFLDEVSELSLELQARLLRALQERVVRPLGGTQALPITARVVAGTNRDLPAMVDLGRFRKDLYFRLNVVSLRIPPLRDRKADIPLLVQHFLDRHHKEHGVALTLSDDALRALVSYDWPGNVRELENAIERACALSSGPTLYMGDLPTQLHGTRLQPVSTGSASPEPAAGTGQERIVSIAEMERQAILGTIRQLRGDKLMAAKLLGIGKTTLYRKLKEYGITDFD